MYTPDNRLKKSLSVTIGMPDDIKDIKKIGLVMEKVSGWLSEKEALFLYKSSKRMSENGEVVEIGSWKGRSTICLAMGARASGKTKIHAIDIHKGDESCGFENTFAEFKKNIKKFSVADVVVPLVMTSKKAAKLWSKKKKPISFLWIDGSHKYEDVKKDVNMWKKYLIDGGMIAFHDTFFVEGPKRVVDEYIFGEEFKDMGFVGEITYAKKSSKISMKQKMNKKYKKLLRNSIIIRRKYGIHRVKESLRK